MSTFLTCEVGNSDEEVLQRWEATALQKQWLFAAKFTMQSMAATPVGMSAYNTGKAVLFFMYMMVDLAAACLLIV